MDDFILCASCSAETPDSERCASCGAPPYLMDRYVLLNCVGSGSFGTTYRAKRLQDGAIFAIKEMMVRRAESLKLMELFEREAQILERLNHPGVPRYIEDFIHEAGRNTAFYLIQEYVVGETLSEAMAGPTQPDEVFQICRQVLEILLYLHSFSPPVIHRDIKLDNIMRRDDGSLVLIDFGSVRAALDSTVGGSTVAGTFGYMAPEQFLGRALPQTDVYAVGACAVAMLSNQDPQSLLKEDRTLDLSQLRLSPHFDFALKEMLKVSTSERPDARAALQLLQTPNPPETRKYTTPPSPGLSEVLNHPLPRPVPKSFDETYFTAGHRSRVVLAAAFSLFLMGPILAAIMWFGPFDTLVWRLPDITWGELLFLGGTLTGLLGALGPFLLVQSNQLRKQLVATWKSGTVQEAAITGLTQRDGAGKGTRRFSTIRYEYVVSGKRHEGYWWTWLKTDIEVGQKVPLLVHPERPEISLLLAVAPADFEPEPIEQIAPDDSEIDLERDQAYVLDLGSRAEHNGSFDSAEPQEDVDHDEREQVIVQET